MPFSQLSSVMLELCPHLFWKPELYLPSLTKTKKSLPDTAISLFSSKSFLKNKVYNTNNLLEYKGLLLYIIYNSNVFIMTNSSWYAWNFLGFSGFRAENLICWKPFSLRQIRTGGPNTDMFLTKCHFKNSLPT